MSRVFEPVAMMTLSAVTSLVEPSSASTEIVLGSTNVPHPLISVIQFFFIR